MPISQSDYIGLTCPACDARFETDAWTLVDAAERSDLAQALREGSLNMATCPKCGTQMAAGTALLLHDPAGRRVYFAVPPNVVEHVWRERAQELLYQLVGSLPEEQRRPYLGDVQVEQELDGVRRALLRQDRRRGAGRASEGVKGRGGDEVNPEPARTPSAPEPLIEALRALLATDSDTEFAAILAGNPALLDDDADRVVRELAELAYADGERDVSTALGELRIVLTRLRSGDNQPLTNDRTTELRMPLRLSPQLSALRPQSSRTRPTRRCCTPLRPMHCSPPRATTRRCWNFGPMLTWRRESRPRWTRAMSGWRARSRHGAKGWTSYAHS